uniref:Uncharacterized protein n=1 Tax=Anopheles coluzzii TaxID=1518534 RepID=A0A8W7Q284_ANOCL
MTSPCCSISASRSCSWPWTSFSSSLSLSLLRLSASRSRHFSRYSRCSCEWDSSTSSSLSFSSCICSCRRSRRLRASSSSESSLFRRDDRALPRVTAFCARMRLDRGVVATSAVAGSDSPIDCCCRSNTRSAVCSSSFCCRSSSRMRISRASARAWRRAANQTKYDYAGTCLARDCWFAGHFPKPDHQAGSNPIERVTMPMSGASSPVVQEYSHSGSSLFASS